MKLFCLYSLLEYGQFQSQNYLRVARIIFTQSSHQNHRDQTDQENDHHERVKNREPVNTMLEEGRIKVLVITIVEGDHRFTPNDLVNIFLLRDVREKYTKIIKRF